MPDDRAPGSSKVFVSYSSMDRDAARRLVDALSARGYDVWFDRLLVGGAVWWAEILERIRQADVLERVLKLGLPVAGAGEAAGHDHDHR
jgi:hypothetical protein